VKLQPNLSLSYFPSEIEEQKGKKEEIQQTSDGTISQPERVRRLYEIRVTTRMKLKVLSNASLV